MTEITRAPDPIKPLRARAIDYWAADSSKWVNVPQAPLWQVVALSLGIEPVSLNMRQREFCPRNFVDRFDVAWASCGHGLPACEHGGSPISMRDFGDWALALPQPLELPEWFPRTTAGARRAIKDEPRAVEGAAAHQGSAMVGPQERLQQGPAGAAARWDHLEEYRAAAVKAARSKSFPSRAQAAEHAAGQLQPKPKAKSKPDAPDAYYPWTKVDEWLKAAGWSAKMSWDEWVASLVADEGDVTDDQA